MLLRVISEILLRPFSKEAGKREEVKKNLIYCNFSLPAQKSVIYTGKNYYRKGGKKKNMQHGDWLTWERVSVPYLLCQDPLTGEPGLLDSQHPHVPV